MELTIWNQRKINIINKLMEMPTVVDLSLDQIN